MAPSKAQQQRAAAKKAARRKLVVETKRKAELVEATGGEARQIAIAAQGPVFRCLMTQGIFRLAMGWVVLARTLPSGSVGAAFFLVDSAERGVKDVFFQTMTVLDFENHIGRIDREMDAFDAVEPAYARKLLHDAVAFGLERGFRPHRDFARTEKLFGEAAMADHVFSFGSPLLLDADEAGPSA